MRDQSSVPSCEPVTDWFPADVSPIREGWYECEECGGERHYFDGKGWMVRKGGAVYFVAPFKWRGLAQEPKP